MFEMKLEEIQAIQSKLDGNHSEMFLQIKDRLGDYTHYEIPFKEDFLFFEDRYLTIMQHMLQHGLDAKQIVDIGCQYGFQSEWHKGMDYVGIDCYQHLFFNQDRDGVRYIVGLFPDVNVDLSESVVISSMSLGYFDHYISNDEKEAMTKIIKGLAGCKHLYISTCPDMIEALKLVFTKWELLNELKLADEDFPMYYFEKDNTDIPEVVELPSLKAKRRLVPMLKRR